MYPTLPTRNIVLGHLPADALALLRPKLTRVHLKKRTVLQEAYGDVATVYFIESGMAAVFARTPQDGPVEVGVVGRFGLVGVPALLGTMRSPNRCIMEIEGDALAIDAADLTRAMEENRALHRHMMVYVQALLVQSSQTSLCNLRHELIQRLAQWLLLASDRLDSDTIPLTHALLSTMLGVRRAGITDALAHLEKRDAIRKSRGAVRIVDRDALGRLACDCYRIIAHEFEQITAASNISPKAAPLSPDREAARPGNISPKGA